METKGRTHSHKLGVVTLPIFLHQAALRMLFYFPSSDRRRRSWAVRSDGSHDSLMVCSVVLWVACGEELFRRGILPRSVSRTCIITCMRTNRFAPSETRSCAGSTTKRPQPEKSDLPRERAGDRSWIDLTVRVPGSRDNMAVQSSLA